MRLKPPVLPVVAFFRFLSGGMAFQSLDLSVCGFKRFGACLLFTLAFCSLVAVSQSVNEIVLIDDSLVKMDAL